MTARRDHPTSARWALFTLDLLEEDERAALAAHLDGCAECLAIVDDERASHAPAPGDAPGHIPAEIIARWEAAVADFGTVERRLYAQHLAGCAQCPAILRRLGHDPGLVGLVASLGHRRPWGTRVSRRLLLVAAAAAAAVAVALVLGPQWFGPSRPGGGAPTIARGPESTPAAPHIAPVDSATDLPAPAPGTVPSPSATATDTTDTSARPGDGRSPTPPANPVPAPAPDSRSGPPVEAPPTAIAGGTPVLVRPAAGAPVASPQIADALARALVAVPGLEPASEDMSLGERYTVRATLGGAPGRASDASRPGVVQARGTLSWELVDRYTGERVATRTATFDSAQVRGTVARMSRQVGEAIGGAAWAGRVQRAEESRVLIESREADGARPGVGAVVELFARGHERVDAESQVVVGYQWIRVGTARIIAVGKDEIVAAPFDVVHGSPGLKDAGLARLQGPQ